MSASSVNVRQAESTRTITIRPGETIAILKPGDNIPESFVRYVETINATQREMNDRILALNREKEENETLINAQNVDIASKTIQISNLNERLSKQDTNMNKLEEKADLAVEDARSANLEHHREMDALKTRMATANRLSAATVKMIDGELRSSKKIYKIIGIACLALAGCCGGLFLPGAIPALIAALGADGAITATSLGGLALGAAGGAYGSPKLHDRLHRDKIKLRDGIKRSIQEDLQASNPEAVAQPQGAIAHSQRGQIAQPQLAIDQSRVSQPLNRQVI
ncbi:MAG: hypothetical protein HW387_1274 [Parachlamydiales bacterium]|nr:hypothetical protein [Parachlamydiales bacterium]